MKAEEERGDLNNSWSGPHTLSLSTQTGQTALHLAVRHGRVVMVRLLLSCGADANIQDSQGTTALMFASERGHTHIARLLLERSQCDLTLTDKVRPHQTNHHVTWETMLANSFLWSFSGITVNCCDATIVWASYPLKFNFRTLNSCDDSPPFVNKMAHLS